MKLRKFVLIGVLTLFLIAMVVPTISIAARCEPLVKECPRGRVDDDTSPSIPNRLNSVAKVLKNVNTRLSSIDAGFIPPPDDGKLAMRDALDHIIMAAQCMLDLVNPFLTVPPDDSIASDSNGISPAPEGTLGQLRSVAQTVHVGNAHLEVMFQPPDSCYPPDPAIPPQPGFPPDPIIPPDPIHPATQAALRNLASEAGLTLSLAEEILDKVDGVGGGIS